VRYLGAAYESPDVVAVGGLVEEGLLHLRVDEKMRLCQRGHDECLLKCSTRNCHETRTTSRAFSPEIAP